MNEQVEDETTYIVVVNHEEQYSIWPDYKEIPKGWRSVGGDNFTLAQLQKDKEEAQRSLDDAQAAKDRALEKRSALIEEARRAGVSPDTFR